MIICKSLHIWSAVQMKTYTSTHGILLYWTKHVCTYASTAQQYMRHFLCPINLTHNWKSTTRSLLFGKSSYVYDEFPQMALWAKHPTQKTKTKSPGSCMTQKQFGYITLQYFCLHTNVTFSGLISEIALLVDENVDLYFPKGNLLILHVQ